MIAEGRSLREAGVLSLSAIVFVLLSTELAARVTVQLALKEQGISLLVVSMSTTMCWIGSLVGGVAWSRLSDRCHPRWLLPSVIVGATASVGILAVGVPVSAVLIMSFFRLLALSGSMRSPWRSSRVEAVRSDGDEISPLFPPLARLVE